MRTAWWYGVVLSTLVWVVGVVVLGVVPEGSPLDRRLGGPTALAMLLAWLVMPLSIALDRRSAGSELAWDPTTTLWVLGSLVWFVNVAVGAAYCLRRYVAASRRAPSRHWETAIAASVGFWVASLVLDYGLPRGTIPDPLYDAMALFVLLTWVAMPVGILLDAVRVRGYTDWRPNTRGYVVGAAIPFVNVVVGAIYLYKRRDAFESVDATASFTLDSDHDEDDPAVPGSPWFRRAGYLFGGYFLLVLLVAVAVPSLSESGIEILGLLLWLPFGPFFAACVYKDAAWRRARDWTVGDNWWLYLCSAVVQAAAFWYVVRRASKSSRYRRRARGGRDTAAE
ncbi:hypothetical protein [Haloarcula sp. JP-L23]|uniref:hypothetical protein n=1 Tax=Haloarcula sp. JP-L23 TaxID=2716717 RepID=UPI00140EC5DD|nr:hypothetical protein G9465_10320 [Haloarcula sp. JP-L23]